MKILVIEDEPSIAQFIGQGLKEAGYTVDVATDGIEGQNYALSHQYSTIILDILLPKMDGLTLLSELRKDKILIPVLLLTAQNKVEDRVKGLDLGADDYLIKPFAFSELLARLRALDRRPPLQFNTVLDADDLTLDIVKRTVQRREKMIDLSPLEFRLLEYLLRHKNQVLTRTQIGETIWNLDFYSNSNVVDVYVGYLRRKVDKDFDTPLIHTIRGVGYCLRDKELINSKN